MTAKYERLSALVDNEAAEIEARRSLKEMPTDGELRERWGRYHLIHDAFQGNLPDQLDLSFTHSVMARIYDEAQSPADRNTGRRRFTPMKGVALAASLAVGSILVLHAVPDGTIPGSTSSEVAKVSAGPTSPLSPVRQVSDQPTLRTAGRPVSATTVAAAQTSPPQTARTEPDNSVIMNSYLVNHTEHTVSTGMIPYARIVGYNMGRR